MAAEEKWDDEHEECGEIHKHIWPLRLQTTACYGPFLTQAFISIHTHFSAAYSTPPGAAEVDLPAFPP